MPLTQLWETFNIKAAAFTIWLWCCLELYGKIYLEKVLLIYILEVS